MLPAERETVENAPPTIAPAERPSPKRPESPQWPVFVPFVETAGGGGEPWHVDFLVHLSANGGRRLAAADAGISQKTLDQALRTDPSFAAEVEAAEGFYRDLLEWESVNLARTRNNPLPYFARLKAELPYRYVDKAITLNANIGADISPVDARALLAEMIRDATPETLARLRRSDRIIDVTPLPEAPEAE